MRNLSEHPIRLIMMNVCFVCAFVHVCSCELVPSGQCVREMYDKTKIITFDLLSDVIYISEASHGLHTLCVGVYFICTHTYTRVCTHIFMDKYSMCLTVC